MLDINQNPEKAFKDQVQLANRKKQHPKPDDESTADADAPAHVAVDDDDDSKWEGLEWTRVPHLQKRAYEHGRGSRPSWIYQYGWPVWHRQQEKKFWLYKDCHRHKKTGGEFNVHQSTSSAAAHLQQNVRGHGISKEGKINFNLPSGQSSILAAMQSDGVEVSQEVANALASSFSKVRFEEAVKDWVIADNQSLRVIERPEFRAMIKAANPMAEASLWQSRNSLRDAILREYKSYIPAVIDFLKQSRSLIHISFDNWTSTGGKRALTGICVHHLDSSGGVLDYLVGLPELHGKHSGRNLAPVVRATLETFEIGENRRGYFVLDNAINNDAAIDALSEEYNFCAPYRRLRCTCHIINLAAQTVIWGKDKEAFENNKENLDEEEKLMEEWRKHGPIGVLFDVISSICTPQARQLLERFQIEEAKRLKKQGFRPKELVKPVKTRWNSYHACFERAAELAGPIDAYIDFRAQDYRAETASRRREPSAERPEPRLFITEGGLTAKEWATITEYIRLLAPFEEATRWLQGRTKVGNHGAIWEVIVAFEFLLNELEQMKERLAEVDYTAKDVPEDHLITNVNAAHKKLSEYYNKLDASPVYYAATILHPTYKHYLDNAWKVPDDWDEAEKGPHPQQDWLPSNHRAFLALWKSYKDRVAVEAADVQGDEGNQRPAKRYKVNAGGSRAAFLDGLMQAAIKQKEQTLDDEFELWKKEPPLSPNDLLAINPIKYWLLQENRYPILTKLALDIYSIPASAADCERAFSELGDLLGTR